MVCNGGLPVSKKNESGLKRKDYERRLQELHVMLVGASGMGAAGGQEDLHCL